jgi:hypothetical protein
MGRRRSRRSRRQPRAPGRFPRTQLAALPQVDLNPVNFMHARFQASPTISNSSEFVSTIRISDLICMPGCIATGSSTLSPIAQAIKIKSVEVWAAPTVFSSANAVVPITVSVVWFNSLGNSSGKTQSDTSLSSAIPSHVVAIPEKESTSSFWLGTNIQTQAAFDIVLMTTSGLASPEVNIYVDVRFNWVASNQSFGPITKTTTTTLSTGLVYYGPLDGPTGVYCRSGLIPFL